MVLLYLDVITTKGGIGNQKVLPITQNIVFNQEDKIMAKLGQYGHQLETMTAQEVLDVGVEEYDDE